jgi:hypothetical protein
MQTCWFATLAGEGARAPSLLFCRRRGCGRSSRR